MRTTHCSATALAVVVVAVALTGALSVACGKAEKMAYSEAAPPPPPPPPPPAVAEAMADEAPMKEMKLADKKVGAVGRGGGGKGSGMAFGAKLKAKADDDGKDEDRERNEPVEKKPAGKSAEAAPTRAWFPETFLFAPKVITDDAGNANVDVLVPDRLTTWRVLALAHSRQGAQAGAVTTMVSQLPVSLDLVVPHFLVAGDRVALPLQVTNTGEKPLVEPLTAKVSAGAAGGGGRLSNVPANVKVDASSTASVIAWLDAPEPGDVVVQADAGTDDSVRKTISVKSPGRPMQTEKSGTLAAARDFTLDLPSDSGAPLPGTARASLQVFPGALAILRAELAAAPDRSGLADDAYLLSLVGNAKPLSTKLGAPVDDKTLAHLSRLAGQRLARYALSPDLSAAMELAPGALASVSGKSEQERTLVERNGEHLCEFVARNQRPDGTFGGGQGWPLPRLISATADGVRAVRAGEKLDDEGKRRAAAATLRARGAFERFQGQIDDPYTAAVVLASGVVEGELRTKLAEKISAAIVQKPDGTRALPVPPVALRGDGTLPTEVEATALAILALHDEPKAAPLLPDLGATVLAAYRPGAGFGDGATNRAALDAVALMFADPLPSKVTVSLTVDDKKIGTDTLEGNRLHEVMTLDGAVSSKSSLHVVVQADPPLPGLSYVLTVEYAVPWPKPERDAGLTLDVKVGGKLTVGAPVDVELRAIAPGGSALHVVQGLPAGVDPVRSTLQALVSSGAITKFDVTDGVVTLDAPARRQGELFNVRYKVVPTLAGSLQARVASVALSSSPNAPVFFPPSTWTIAR